MLEWDVAPEWDVVIVGAGLSGIGAAARLSVTHPELRWVVLEARAVSGGTWDAFRYPGIRSDSDMLTLGYRFRPWRGGAALADGPAILDYIRDTAREYDVDRHIRYGHRLLSADWDSSQSCWTLQVDTSAGASTMQTRFLWSCTGYFDYAGGHRPDFPGEQDFGGRIVHPQDWPDDLELVGRTVAVVGSGATAVTLVPALAREAAHVTMVQRSPTFIVSRPAHDGFASLLTRWLPERIAYRGARAKNITAGAAGFLLSRRYPRLVRRLLEGRVRAQLPPDVDVGRHFSPRYDPWDQRICLVPDGDLFEALRSGSASVVTGEISRFTAEGIEMASGEVVVADTIVTATGLRLLPFGGVCLSVDGRPVEVPNTMAYRAMMLGGIPNLVFTIGYTNASWTLKADLVADFVCRLLGVMTARGYRSVVPRLDPTVDPEPLLHFTSGYVVRALDRLPKQGSREPWRLGKSYLHDVWTMRRARIEDGVLQFRR